ncbi:hypothetical protein AURDEDRAFT_184344, partial [Auricularia subglabra TFB-10046 SS5]
MGGVARRTSFEMKAGVSVDIGAINIDWGVSASRSEGGTSTVPISAAATCAITRGPSGWDGSATSNNLSTVVVRPIRVKRRQKVVSQLLSLLRASTTHGSPIVDDPGARPTMSPEMGFPTASSSVSREIDSHMDSDYSDTSMSSDSSGGGSTMEGDFLEIILQKVLDEYPSIDVVSGSWDIVGDLLSVNGDLPLDPNVGFLFEYDAQNDQKVAFITALVPGIAYSHSETSYYPMPGVSQASGTILQGVSPHSHGDQDTRTVAPPVQMTRAGL